RGHGTFRRHRVRYAMRTVPVGRVRRLRRALMRRLRRAPRLHAVLTREMRRYRGVESLLVPGRKRVRRTWGEALSQWRQTRQRGLRGFRPIYRCERVEFATPGTARIATEEVLGPDRGEVMIETLVSAVSMGTERALLAGGLFPRYRGHSLAGRGAAA